MNYALEDNHLTGEFGLTNKINRTLNEIRDSFIYIGFLLDEADRCQYYLEGGFDSIYSYCESSFGFKRSTTNNLIRIYRNFGDTMCLKERYRNYSYSQLTEMCSMNVNQLELCTPEMTVKDLRELKKNNVDFQTSKKVNECQIQTSGKVNLSQIQTSVKVNNLHDDNELIDYSCTGPVLIEFPRQFVILFFNQCLGYFPSEFDLRYFQTLGSYNDVFIKRLFKAIGYDYSSNHTEKPSVINKF